MNKIPGFLRKAKSTPVSFLVNAEEFAPIHSYLESTPDKVDYQATYCTRTRRWRVEVVCRRGLKARVSQLFKSLSRKLTQMATPAPSLDVTFVGSTIR